MRRDVNTFCEIYKPYRFNTEKFLYVPTKRFSAAQRKMDFLFNRNRFCQIPWLINIAPKLHRGIIGQKLQWDD